MYNPMKFANKKLFQVRNGVRANSRKVLIILDDGKQARGVTEATIEAKQLREQGVKVIVISFGGNTDVTSGLMRLDNGRYGYFNESGEILEEAFVGRIRNGLIDIGTYLSFDHCASAI